MNHVLPKLPYGYDALEPYIDAQTMEIHHAKHHQAYIDKLNAVLENLPDFKDKSLEELLKSLKTIPESSRLAVQNHGGGHYNHSLFWTLLSKNSGQPEAELAKAINDAFGDMTQFKAKFGAEASARFGSGWAWLVVNNGQLAVMGTANQDSPLSEGMTPILGIDVWEHAYYLKYQNRRSEYIEAFFNIINWEKVSELYQQAK
ncbi:MAG: superoxide dismutase [bacterium]|nr:superoxide dismutase [bacterium]